MTGLLRLRIILVAAAMAIVALIAGNVFDRPEWWLLVAVGLPAFLAIAVQSFPTAARLITAIVGVVGSVSIVVFVRGGDVDDLTAALTAGTQRLLSTEWPSPARPDLVGAIALLLAIATAVGADLASRRRWHLLALVPLAIASAAVIALSAPSGVRLLWLIPVGLAAAAFATLRPSADSERGLADKLTLLRGERRLVPVVVLAGLVAAALSVPTALAERADPRRNDPAEQTAPLLDPIESTLALRALDPPIDLHTATGARLPGRWRTAALSNYDGQRWTPTLTLRPIGRRLAPDRDQQLSYSITFLDDDLTLVPLPGRPVTIEAAVETDDARTVVRLGSRVEPTDEIDVTAAVAPTSADAATIGIATRAVDDSASSLTEFAEGLAGDGTVLERLRRIEATMRDDWVLASNAPGGGLQNALIDRFLRDTRRGTAEQFATAYALLARSLGVDARVATGFIAADTASGNSVVLTSADAAVWPEIRLVDGRWLAFDPIPPDEASDIAPPPEEPAVQTPAAAQPPIAPPPEPTTDAQDDNEATDGDAQASRSTLVRWVQGIAVGIAAVLLPLVAIAALILLTKARRRRRRLRSGSPEARIAGTWAVATDRLVDAGLTITPASTNGDIAAAGAPLAARADRELLRLASLSSAVTFGSPSRPDLLVEDAGACLGQIETSMSSVRTRSERLRWRLSLRSLRSATRSPLR